MGFNKFDFTKEWTDAAAFPAIETDEKKVREDMQALPDELRAAIHKLIDELEATTAAASLGATGQNGESSTVQEELNTFTKALRDHIDIDPSSVRDNNVSVTGARMEDYGLGELTNPTVAHALDRLAPFARCVDGKNFPEWLLSGETAVQLWLDAQTATPDDAFRELTPKIGDIRTSIRDTLGKNWLLCNGDIVSALDYPELTALFPQDEKLEFTVGATKKFTKARGMYAALGTTKLWVTEDLTKEWSAIDIAATFASDLTGEVSLTLHDLVVVDGVWTILCSINDLGGLLTAEDIYGAWEFHQICSTAFSGPSLYYADGKWLVTRIPSGSGTVRAWYADSVDGPWNESDVATHSQSDGNYIRGGNAIYWGGHWYITYARTIYDTGDGGCEDDIDYAYIYKLADPQVGTWERVKLFKPYHDAHRWDTDKKHVTLSIVDGKIIWSVITDYVGSTAQTNYGSYFFESEDADTWGDPVSSWFESDYKGAVKSITKQNGELWVCLSTGLYKTPDLKTAPTKVYKPNTSYKYEGTCVVFEEHGWTLVTGSTKYLTHEGKALPTITPGKSYAYIRAK